MLLEKYVKEQLVATKILMNAITDDKISHAYIFETNDYSNADDYIKSFIKDIIGKDLKDKIIQDNIFQQIDRNEYIELKIIDTQNIQIKKEEMLNLQDEFKNKPALGKYNIYVIKNAEKLNNFSANTILKFLEEPEDFIIAILVTNNRYQIMKTILSRCQIITLNNDVFNTNICTFEKLNKIIYNVQCDEDLAKKKEDISKIIDFILFYEKNNIDTLLYSNKEFIQYFSNREDLLSAFEVMKLFYLDSLKLKTNTEIEIFNDNIEELTIVAKNNSLESILNKINVIIEYIDKIKLNLNTNLLIDSMIIKLGGIEYD